MIATLACGCTSSLPLSHGNSWPKNAQEIRLRWGKTPGKGGRKITRMRMVGAWSWRSTAVTTAAAATAEKEEEAATPSTSSLSSIKAHLLLAVKGIGLQLFNESSTFRNKDSLSFQNAVAGLDRGLVANETDVMTADSAAKKIEASGGIVDLSTGLDKLQGRWRLIYSSAFASGSLGGLRPGPPTGRLPLTLGQVFQRIDIVGREFDNIVNLQIGTPWPLPPIEVTVNLAHRFEVIGCASIRIIFERTIIQSAGSLSQLPPLELPQLPEFLRPPSSLRSGDFEVTFVDDDLRITRGDRGELRVFLKS